MLELAIIESSVLYKLGVDLIGVGPPVLSIGRKLRNQLGTLASEHNLGENHDLIRALRKARLLACITVVQEARRKTNTRIEDSPFLSSIEQWINTELARSINNESDPRYIDDSDSEIEFADDEKLRKAWQTLKQTWNNLIGRNDAGNKTLWVGPCELMALCQIWQFFLSDEAQKQASTDEDDSPIEELAKKFNTWAYSCLLYTSDAADE